MAVLDPSGIVNGQPVLAPQVSNLYNALNGNASYDLIVNGDLTVSSNGIIYGGSISGSSFTGSGLSLTGVITDTLSGSFLTTASFQTFSSSFITTSQSLASRIVSNDQDITNLFVASQSLESGQQALENFSASLIIDHLNDVTTVGGAFQALDGNVLVYDDSVSKWRPSRSNVNVNITGSTTIEGPTTLTGNITGTGDLNLTGATNLNGNSSITGSTNITGTTTIVGSTHLSGSSNISGSLDVSGPTALTGALAIVGDTTTAGDVFITGNLTASNNISASGDMFATTGSFLHLSVSAGGNLTGDLVVNGDITASGVISASGDLIGDDLLLGTGRIIRVGGSGFIDFSGNPVTGITALTASQHIFSGGNISASGDVSGVTGSFSHLDGHSPLTVGADSTIFLQSITASNDISASGDIHAVTGSFLNLNIPGGSTTNGASVISGSVTITGPSTITGSLGISQGVTVGGTLIGSSANFTGPVTASSANLGAITATVVNGTSFRQTFGPVTSVSIDHNLDEDFPIVQVYTASNRAQIIPISIISDDENRVSVTFAINTTGSIVILK